MSRSGITFALLYGMKFWVYYSILFIFLSSLSFGDDTNSNPSSPEPEITVSFTHPEYRVGQTFGVQVALGMKNARIIDYSPYNYEIRALFRQMGGTVFTQSTSLDGFGLDYDKIISPIALPNLSTDATIENITLLRITESTANPRLQSEKYSFSAGVDFVSPKIIAQKDTVAPKFSNIRTWIEDDKRLVVEFDVDDMDIDADKVYGSSMGAFSHCLTLKPCRLTFSYPQQLFEMPVLELNAKDRSGNEAKAISGRDFAAIPVSSKTIINTSKIEIQNVKTDTSDNSKVLFSFTVSGGGGFLKGSIYTSFIFVNVNRSSEYASQNPIDCEENGLCTVALPLPTEEVMSEFLETGRKGLNIQLQIEGKNGTTVFDGKFYEFLFKSSKKENSPKEEENSQKNENSSNALKGSSNDSEKAAQKIATEKQKDATELKLTTEEKAKLDAIEATLRKRIQESPNVCSTQLEAILRQYNAFVHTRIGELETLGRSIQKAKDDSKKLSRSNSAPVFDDFTLHWLAYQYLILQVSNAWTMEGASLLPETLCKNPEDFIFHAHETLKEHTALVEAVSDRLRDSPTRDGLTAIPQAELDIAIREMLNPAKEVIRSSYKNQEFSQGVRDWTFEKEPKK